MKRITALVAILLVSLSASAQISFERGSVLKADGTLIENVLVRNNGDLLSAEGVTYKESDRGEKKTLPIDEVVYFTVGGQLYEHHKVGLDASGKNVQDGLSASREPELVSRNVFLEVLVDGDVKLYHHVGKGFKDNYFISTPENPHPEYLVYKQYTDRERVYENTAFRAQLYKSLKERGISKEEVQNLSYSEDALIKFFLKANSDSNSGSKVMVQRLPGRKNISLTMREQFQDAIDREHEFRILTPYANLSYEYIPSAKQYKWSIFGTAGISKRPVYIDEGDQTFFSFGFGGRYYMYLAKNVTMFSEVYYETVFNPNLNVGAGIKLGQYCSLGFGYHKLNMNRLIFSRSVNDHPIDYYRVSISRIKNRVITFPDPFSFYLRIDIPVGNN